MPGKLHTGTLSTWNDEKGYGFITPDSGGDRVFVHITAFDNQAQRPAVGDVVSYARARDEDGRSRAEAVSLVNGRRRSPFGWMRFVVPLSIAVGFIGILYAAVGWTGLPVPVPAYVLLASLVTFAVYAIDKAAAIRGAWRTSESTLHLLALAGGWPGALVAQYGLRHKSRKQPFRTVFWITLVLNCAVLAWLLTPGGQAAWADAVDLVRQTVSLVRRRWGLD